MNLPQRLLGLGLLLGLTFLIEPNSGASFQPDDPDLPPPEFSVETRGPVHEAFARPVDGKTEISLAVQKEPPPPLPEQPPEQRPDNPNLEWIPGYWAWDADRTNFVWVSGTFRDPPLGRRWVPGHWSNSPEGWRWAPGFWAGENRQDLQYTPEPPAPLEDGPTLPPPDDNSAYIPGYWNYNGAEQRFAWRPGYYAPYRAGRMWIGPQYNWTPRGYLYNDGYWDAPFADRGVLFAPAYFPTPLWNNPGWVYRPNFVVSFGNYFDSCFYRPGFSHFYFGNFYGNNYVGLGYRPWWGLRRDPHFNYYQWQNRNNPQWAGQQRQLYDDRQAGRAAVPPANFAQQQAFRNGKNQGGPALVTPINRFVPPNGRMQPNTQVAAQNLQIRQNQDLAQLRSTLENVPRNSTAPLGARPNGEPSMIKLPPAPPRIRPGGGPNQAGVAGGPSNSGSGFNKGETNIPSPIVIGKGRQGGPGVNPTPRPIVNNSNPPANNQPPATGQTPPTIRGKGSPGVNPTPRPIVNNPNPPVNNLPPVTGQTPPAFVGKGQPGGPGVNPTPRPIVNNPNPPVNNLAPATGQTPPVFGGKGQPGGPGVNPMPRPIVNNPNPPVNNLAPPTIGGKGQPGGPGVNPTPRPIVNNPSPPPNIAPRNVPPTPAPRQIVNPTPQPAIQPRPVAPAPVIQNLPRPNPTPAPVQIRPPAPQPTFKAPQPAPTPQIRPAPQPVFRAPTPAPAPRMAPPPSSPPRNFSPPAMSRPPAAPAGGPRPGGGGSAPRGGGKK